MALLLGACASSVRTDVTRFHDLTLPAGETFIVIAKTEDKKGSLELQNYARLVSQYLRAEGFTSAGEDTPDLIVQIDYSVSPPLERTRRSGYGFPYYYGGHFYSGFGHRRLGHHGFGHHGFGYYPYYGSYYNYGSYTYTVYESRFDLSIKENSGVVVFEGRVTNLGRDRELPKIMPVLVEAMFTNFPGQSGATDRIKIKSAKGGEY